jgi:hypothetical protein
MKYQVVGWGRKNNRVCHQWTDGPENFHVGQLISEPGKVFYQTWRIDSGNNQPDQRGVWFDAPAWVYAAIGEADDMAGVLDWLVERFPDHARLHDAVRRVAAAGLTAGGVPA